MQSRHASPSLLTPSTFPSSSTNIDQALIGSTNLLIWNRKRLTWYSTKQLSQLSSWVVLLHSTPCAFTLRLNSWIQLVIMTPNQCFIHQTPYRITDILEKCYKENPEGSQSLGQFIARRDSPVSTIFPLTIMDNCIEWLFFIKIVYQKYVTRTVYNL